MFKPSRRSISLAVGIASLVVAVTWYAWPRHYTRIVKIPQSSAGKEQASFEVLKASAAVDSIAWSPDGKTLAVQTKPKEAAGSGSSAILLWDVGASRQQRVIFETSDSIFSAAFSPDGKTLACATWRRNENQEGEVLRWNTATGKKIGTLVGTPRIGLGVPFTSDPLSIAFSPDGRWVAAGTKLVDAGNNQGAHIGGEVCLWDAESGELKWFDRSTHSDIVYAVAFSSDGKFLASAGSDKLIRIWDAETGRLRRTLVGAAWDGIGSLAFSPKGTLLASGGSGREEGGIVRIWDVEAADVKHTMSTQFRRNGNGHVAFSPDGETLFAVGQTHDPGASPDGKNLAVGTWEGDIILIDLDR